MSSSSETAGQPAILPPQETDDRPLWSVMIPSYNCAAFLKSAIESVLSQDPGPDVMQIEVVDDHSTQEDTEAVTREVGRGRVGYFRQARNLGHTRNLNTCLQRSRGRLVHVLHGDDLVRPGFYARMGAVFEDHPEAGAAFCRFIAIDDMGRWRSVSAPSQSRSGLLADGLATIASTQPVQTVATVVRRSVYETVGGFATAITCCGEDWEMWLRIAARYPIWYETEPLACYRVHDDSLTGNAVREAANTRELMDVIEMARRYFPPESAAALTARARAHTAAWALELAGDLLRRGDGVGARRQIAQALRLSRSPRLVGRASYLTACLAAHALGLTNGRT